MDTKQSLGASFLLVLGMLMGQLSLAQKVSPRLLDNLDNKSFVRNDGQFDTRLPVDGIRYAFEGDGQQIFMADHQVYFNLYRAKLRVKSPEEKAARAEQKRKGFDSPEAYTAFEKAGKRFDYTTDLLAAEWLNTSPDAQLVAEEMDDFTHTYEYREGRNLLTRSGVHSYKKLIYKNLYPHVDVEYTLHPESGIKYSLILHPGADLSQVQLRYSKQPQLQADGTIATATRFGNITDMAPMTFYAQSQLPIASAYHLQGDVISFQLANYDPSQTVIIDPWTNLPNDPGSNWNCAWECETDALGNSYAIFGAMPMQLRKYNAAGAVQWTYNTTYDTTSWLGTFVTDDAGNSFVTNGSTAAIRRVNTAGALVWSVGNITGQLLGEFWNIAFNCDQTRLITGGTGGAFNPIPYIFEINPVNGALLGSVQVHQGTGLLSPSEVRAITATENAKYYWLTHDSIGILSQSFANCSSASSSLIANNNYDLSYKCENWRYNNTGIEAMAYYNGFVYVNRGNRLDKRSAATSAIVATAPIPGGGFTNQFGGNFVENSGIIIDNTGNIFVGSKGSVSQFNTSLALIATYPVSGGFNVYDVDLTSTGELIACGASGTSATAARTGTVQSLGVLGAVPYAMTCCDASICPIGPLCDNGAPVTLTTSGTAGTWTSSAPGFNPSTGVFDPSVAGIGSYTFYNTVACGVDSIRINVVFCPTLSVCVLGNGDLFATGSAGPFTWQTGTMVSSCPFGPGAGCNFLTHAVNTLTWTNAGSGSQLTPPIGADTVRVSDGSLEFTSWNIATLPPCIVFPVELVAFEGQAITAGHNQLSWTVATETDVQHYTIQRSVDGSNFNYLATVAAQGNTNQEMEYALDDAAAFAPITYYRLSLMDRNGQYQYLSTIAVRADAANDYIFELYPNPAVKDVHFTYTGPKSQDQSLKLQMVNELGTVVMEQQWSAPAHNTPMTINISNLAAGVYAMRFQMGAHAAYRKLVVWK